MKQLYFLLLKNNIAPRWVVFLFDLFICVLSLVYANYLRYNFSLEVIPNHYLAQQALILTFVNAFFFVVFRTYEGIIRFSGLKESLRCTTAIFYSFFLLSLINIVTRFMKVNDLIPMSVLIIYFFTSSFLIFGYRFLVKNLYAQSITNKVSSNVVIFGGELNGSTLKRTIEDSGKHYRVVAFIDDDEKYIGKSIDGTKIYTFAQIKHVIKSWQIKMLFFAKQDMDLKTKNEIVDFCLSHNITVKTIPPVSEWLHGHFTINQIKEVKIEDLLNRPAIELANTHIQQYLKDKKVLITGAAGSIGSEIARQVASINPKSLILCDQTESGLYELEYELKQNGDKNMFVYIGDVRDKKSMHHLFATFTPDVVFHAAAYKHVPLMEQHPSEAIRNNVMGSMLLADLSEKFGVERFLFVSTDKAINPTNVMGASKRIAEIYVQALHERNNKLFIDESGLIDTDESSKTKTKFITTRFGNVLGSNGSVIPRFKNQIAAGGPLTVTHPDIIRYFMTIPEACSLVLEAATMGNGGEIFLFDMGEPVKILELANKMIKLAGLIPGKDIEIKFTGLRPGEKLYEELLNKKEEVVPTHHKKILIAKVIQQEYEIIANKITCLIDHAISNNDEEVVKQMKVIVPEYKSQNSQYERLDKELRPAL
ncbi:MAG: polysaccharide biosynthesis protein [Filimonas sp.]|nr:polysaccharide biosynthesis protein [Filimonas sp.]